MLVETKNDFITITMKCKHCNKRYKYIGETREDCREQMTEDGWLIDDVKSVCPRCKNLP